jgi:hypothetical protein
MPRFQFTIRVLLWATFWVAVACGSWVIASQQSMESDLYWYAWRIGVVAPCIAVGTLFGKFKWGLYFGILVIALIYLYIAITRSFPL